MFQCDEEILKISSVLLAMYSVEGEDQSGLTLTWWQSRSPLGPGGYLSAKRSRLTRGDNPVWLYQHQQQSDKVFPDKETGLDLVTNVLLCKHLKSTQLGPMP